MDRDAIARVLGPIDDSLAAELAATGASAEDLPKPTPGSPATKR
jgi:hypothetical protein